MINLRKYIAYSPQEIVLFENTLRQNLFLDINNKNIKARENQTNLIKEWFKRLNMEYLLDREVGLDNNLNLTMECFSKGEIKRICLIRTFLKNKPIEIYDEPTTFLDQRNSNTIRKLILKRSKSKMILIASHDEILINLCSKKIYL